MTKGKRKAKKKNKEQRCASYWLLQLALWLTRAKHCSHPLPQCLSLLRLSQEAPGAPTLLVFWTNQANPGSPIIPSRLIIDTLATPDITPLHGRAAARSRWTSSAFCTAYAPQSVANKTPTPCRKISRKKGHAGGGGGGSNSWPGEVENMVPKNLYCAHRKPADDG